MKEKQIEAELREQMLALESQMKRLQEWRDTGYSATMCDKQLHSFSDIETHITGPSSMTVRSKCGFCGIEKSTHYRISDEFFYDDWKDFREGGEEE